MRGSTQGVVNLLKGTILIKPLPQYEFKNIYPKNATNLEIIRKTTKAKQRRIK